MLSSTTTPGTPKVYKPSCSACWLSHFSSNITYHHHLPAQSLAKPKPQLPPAASTMPHATENSSAPPPSSSFMYVSSTYICCYIHPEAAVLTCYRFSGTTSSSSSSGSSIDSDALQQFVQQHARDDHWSAYTMRFGASSSSSSRSSSS